MKRKLLSAAVSALALGGFAQSAQATSYDLYLAGSSAQDNLIMNEVANLCVSGTLTYYVDDNYGSSTASTWGNNYKAYACTINSAVVTNLNSGDFVTFHKVNFGGSATGVAPLFTNTAVNTLNINNGNCYQLTTGYTSKVGNTTPGVQTYACRTTVSNDLTAQYLDAGVSDVNPTLFQGVNQTTAYNQTGGVVTAYAGVTSIPSGFTVVPANSLVWAVPVSLNLYTALQAAQGLLSSSLSSYGTGSCAAGQYSIDPTNARDGACLPSLNKSQLSSIISGAISDWSVFNFNGVNLVTAANDYNSHVASSASITPSLGTTVYFCQRTPGSGTAAGQYAYFLNQPANSGDVVQPANNLGNDFVFSIADGGNMESCLVDFATGSASSKDYTNTPVNTVASPVNTAWAIGQQSSDKNASATKAYRFVKINGFAPTLANAFSGAYDFTSESTWQYATTAASGRTQQQAIVKQLIKNITNPTTVYTDLNQYTVQQYGAAGFLGTVKNAVALNSSYTVPSAVSLTYPVNPWTHTDRKSVV